MQQLHVTSDVCNIILRSISRDSCRKTARISCRMREEHLNYRKKARQPCYSLTRNGNSAVCIMQFTFYSPCCGSYILQIICYSSYSAVKILQFGVCSLYLIIRFLHMILPSVSDGTSDITFYLFIFPSSFIFSFASFSLYLGGAGAKFRSKPYDSPSTPQCVSHTAYMGLQWVCILQHVRGSSAYRAITNHSLYNKHRSMK